MSSYDNTHRFLADVLAHSYNNPNSRPSRIEFNGVFLDYKPEKSTSLYAHYESNKVIIVGVHGANDSKLNITAIGEFFNPDVEQREIKRFCRKYSELIEESKEVFLVGHSLGAFAIVSCSRRFKKKLRAFLYAPYVPRQFGKVHRDIRRTMEFKKILYTNDWLASNMLKGKGKLLNTLVFEPKNIVGFFYSHGMSNYQRNPNIMNKDLKKFIN